jgi:hypothetical protein
MNDRLNIVTGAPGAGKTAALEAFLALRAPFVAWDIDWLLAPGSALAGLDIRTTAAAWPAYNSLWLEVLHGLIRNGATPVLFAPLDPRDLPAGTVPSWCGGVRWLLLDCSDKERIRRLAARGDQAGVQAEALADATFLRSAIPDQVDTEGLSPAEVAARVLTWLREGSPVSS